jgi:hypothetical protein
MAMEFHIICKNEEDRKVIGKDICESLVSSPGYINNEIFVNYTDPDSNEIVVIAGNNNSNDIALYINSEDITII